MKANLAAWEMVPTGLPDSGDCRRAFTLIELLVVIAIIAIIAILAALLMGDRTAMTGEWLAHCAACPVPEI